MNREKAYGFPPLPDVLPPLPTEPPLDSSLAELSGFWLHMRCSAHGRIEYPIRLLAAQHGWQTRFGDISSRLTCDVCGAPLSSAELINLLPSPDADPSSPFPRQSVFQVDGLV